MEESTMPEQQSRPFPTGKAVAGVLIVVTLVTAIVLLRRKTAEPEQTALSTTTTSTPKSYTDFLGTVTALNGATVTVVFTATNEQGVSSSKTHVVTVGASTVLRTASSATQQETGDSELSALKVGETVYVAGSGDLSTQDSFTATKLIRYAPAS